VLRRYETESRLGAGEQERWLMLILLRGVIGLNVYLFAAAPKGLLHAAGTPAALTADARATKSISTKAMGREVPPKVSTSCARTRAVGHRGRLNRRRAAGGGFMFRET